MKQSRSVLSRWPSGINKAPAVFQLVLLLVFRRVFNSLSQEVDKGPYPPDRIGIALLQHALEDRLENLVLILVVCISDLPPIEADSRSAIRLEFRQKI